MYGLNIYLAIRPRTTAMEDNEFCYGLSDFVKEQAYLSCFVGCYLVQLWHFWGTLIWKL